MKQYAKFYVPLLILALAFVIIHRGGRALPPAKLFVFDTNIARYGQQMKKQGTQSFTIEIPRHGDLVTNVDAAQTGN